MSRIFWVPVAAAGTDVQVAAGSLAISGYAPTISQPVALVPGYGVLTLAGFAPSVTQSAGTNVLPAVGSLTITGYAPSVAQPNALQPAVGSLTITGYAPSVAQPNALQPAIGSLTITGYAPTVAQPNNVTAGVGSVTITGYAPGIAQPQTAAPGYGSLALAGYAPSVSQSSASPNLIPDFGALSITGYAPTIEQSSPATAGGGRFKRKRVFIDGKAYFLNPQEVANLLIARAAADPEEAPEELEAEEAAAIDPAPMPVIDYKAIRADSVQASREFIARMNAEIERMRSLAIQRQIEEEDDIECLLLLMA